MFRTVKNNYLVVISTVVLSLLFAQLPNTSVSAVVRCTGLGYPPEFPECLDPVFLAGQDEADRIESAREAAEKLALEQKAAADAAADAAAKAIADAEAAEALAANARETARLAGVARQAAADALKIKQDLEDAKILAAANAQLEIAAAAKRLEEEGAEKQRKIEEKEAIALAYATELANKQAAADEAAAELARNRVAIDAEIAVQAQALKDANEALNRLIEEQAKIAAEIAKASREKGEAEAAELQARTDLANANAAISKAQDDAADAETAYNNAPALRASLTVNDYALEPYSEMPGPFLRVAPPVTYLTRDQWYRDWQDALQKIEDEKLAKKKAEDDIADAITKFNSAREKELEQQALAEQAEKDAADAAKAKSDAESAKAIADAALAAEIEIANAASRAAALAVLEAERLEGLAEAAREEKRALERAVANAIARVEILLAQIDELAADRAGAEAELAIVQGVFNAASGEADALTDAAISQAIAAGAAEKSAADQLIAQKKLEDDAAAKALELQRRNEENARAAAAVIQRNKELEATRRATAEAQRQLEEAIRNQIAQAVQQRLLAAAAKAKEAQEAAALKLAEEKKAAEEAAQALLDAEEAVKSEAQKRAEQSKAEAERLKAQAEQDAASARAKAEIAADKARAKAQAEISRIKSNLNKLASSAAKSAEKFNQAPKVPDEEIVEATKGVEQAKSVFEEASQEVTALSTQAAEIKATISSFQEKLATEKKVEKEVIANIEAVRNEISASQQKYEKLSEEISKIQISFNEIKGDADSAFQEAQTRMATAQESKLRADAALAAYKDAVKPAKLTTTEKPYTVENPDIGVELNIGQSAETDRLKILADQATARYKRDKALADAAKKKSDIAQAELAKTKKLLEAKVAQGKKLQSKIQISQDKLNKSQAKLASIAATKNSLAKKISDAKVQAIEMKNAITAARAKQLTAEVKLNTATATLKASKAAQANSEKIANAQGDALSAIDKAKESVSNSESKIQEISSGNGKNIFIRSLPLILTIVGVVAVVSFFATMVIRRGRRNVGVVIESQKDAVPDGAIKWKAKRIGSKKKEKSPAAPEQIGDADLDRILEGFYKKKEKSATKAAAKKAPEKKSAAKQAVVTKKAPVKKSAVKKSVVKKSPAKKASRKS